MQGGFLRYGANSTDWYESILRKYPTPQSYRAAELMFLGVVSASSARRKFWRWREKYKLVRERLAKTFNAAIGVLTATKNGGYALIRTGDPIIMSDVL